MRVITLNVNGCPNACARTQVGDSHAGLDCECRDDSVDLKSRDAFGILERLLVLLRVATLRSDDGPAVARFVAGLRVIVSRRDLGFWYTGGTMPLLRLNARFVDAAVAIRLVASTSPSLG